MNRVTLRKWLEIVRFEVAHQLRRRSTLVFFALLLFPLMGETNGQVLEAIERGILFNSPLFLAASSIGMSMILLLVFAAVAGDAATRDVQTRLEPLMHAAPVGRAPYLFGRFLGAFLVCALILTSVPIALIAAPFVHDGFDAHPAGPFRAAAHVQAYCLLLLPNLFVATAILFALATLVRHVLGSYLGAGILFVATILGTELVGEKLGHWELAKLLSPIGHASLEVMQRTWSPVDSSTRLVGLDGGLFWNRVLWFVLACAALAFTHARFRYGGDAGDVRWWQRGRIARERAVPFGDARSVRSAPIAVPDAPRDFGAVGRGRQTLAIARDSLREMTTRWSWLLLVFMALQVLLAIEEMQIREAPVLATTGSVLKAFSNLPPPLVGSIFAFTLLFAGELVWRERDANMQSLADAAPVPDGVRFVGKLLGLWVLILTLRGLLVLGGVVLQLTRGSEPIEAALYLQILFGLELIGPMVFALFALSVHVLVNQKHVGHLIVLLLVIAPLNLAPMLGLEHPLLVPFSGPGWRYSPISGFEPFVAPVLSLAAYWAAWTLLFAIVARLFWVRGVKSGIAERVRVARRRVRGRTLVTLAAAAGLVLLVAAFVFYNTNVLNEYQPYAAGPERQAEYERRYAHSSREPQPTLTATKLDVEIHPDQRAATIRGVHHVSNRTSGPIDAIHVAVSSQVTTSAIEFGRAAHAALVDDELGQRTYRLAEPLQPGESLSMSWEVRYESRGFGAHDAPTSVVANGTFIETPKWIPLIGYQAGRELGDAVERETHGLPARLAIPSLDDPQARLASHSDERVDVEITVGTELDQTAIAPGELRETWIRDGRRYFHYVTDAPVGQGYAIFSAEYQVRSDRWNDVALEIVHHPAHDRNVERMMRSMQLCLAQFTRRFGPYPYATLRLVEYPGAGAAGAHAASGTIWYEADMSLIDAERDARRIDLLFGVVAHEVGHQFQASLARVEGIILLSESFAWYAALGVIEEEYGAAHLGRFLDFMRRDYLDPRSRADVPLLRASDRFLGYRKGPFAMYALREYVGQERVDLAWRRLIEEHRSHEPPFATSLDLYAELLAVTPDSHHALLHDLFEANTFWELETRRAAATRNTDGTWLVTLDVHARKVAVDTDGVETTVPMDDLVEIGVFAEAPEGADPGPPLHLEMHRIASGPQTITVTVPSEPARAGIDPRHLLIDVTMEDNVRSVERTRPLADSAHESSNDPRSPR